MTLPPLNKERTTKMADNKVRYGLENVYIALKTDDGYETPVHIPGAVNLTADPEGDQSKFYADDIPYVTFTSNSGYTGELEMALIPDEILKKILNFGVDTKSVVYEDASAAPAPFALLYEVKGDAKKRRNIFYNVTAARPSNEYSTTEDSIEPQTETLEITMIPATIGDLTITRASCDSDSAAYTDWFTKVYEPTVAPTV